MDDKATEIVIKPVANSMPLMQFLAACNLPVSDLSCAESLQLFGAFSGSDLIGTVGLELTAPVALLRSLAVAPAHRGQGVGERLVALAERHAAMNGVDALYLLTTTAASFFTKLGYAFAERADAPAAIQATAQFSGLCPASSIFMAKYQAA
jgi:amino-acid N-acetyltransferase